MLVLDIGIAEPVGPEFDRWLSEVSSDAIVAVPYKQHDDHVTVRLFAQSAYDLDQWLRNHYVLDSAGPALEEDVLDLMAMAYKHQTRGERVADAVLWIFAGAIGAFAIWALINVARTGKPW